MPRSSCDAASRPLAAAVPRDPPFCSAAPFVISPDGCVQIRPIWRLSGHDRSCMRTARWIRRPARSSTTLPLCHILPADYAMIIAALNASAATRARNRILVPTGPVGAYWSAVGQAPPAESHGHGRGRHEWGPPRPGPTRADGENLESHAALSANSAPTRPRAARAGAAPPLLASEGLPVREHLAEPPGADVIDEPPDRNLRRDPWM
jgi:hypothetical protein